MESKTLRTLQTVHKIAKVLCTLVIIFSAIGAVGSLLGIFGFLFLPDSVTFGEITLHSFILNEAGATDGTVICTLAATVIVCLGEGFLAKIGKSYFSSELDAGTPFTLDGARALRSYGIKAIVIPLLTDMAASILYSVIAFAYEDVAEYTSTFGIPLTLGIMLLVASLLCKYGAELRGDTSDE